MSATRYPDGNAALQALVDAQCELRALREMEGRLNQMRHLLEQRIRVVVVNEVEAVNDLRTFAREEPVKLSLHASVDRLILLGRIEGEVNHVEKVIAIALDEGAKP